MPKKCVLSKDRHYFSHPQSFPHLLRYIECSYWLLRHLGVQFVNFNSVKCLRTDPQMFSPKLAQSQAPYKIPVNITGTEVMLFHGWKQGLRELLFWRRVNSSLKEQSNQISTFQGSLITSSNECGAKHNKYILNEWFEKKVMGGWAERDSHVGNSFFTPYPKRDTHTHTHTRILADLGV